MNLTVEHALKRFIRNVKIARTSEIFSVLFRKFIINNDSFFSTTAAECELSYTDGSTVLSIKWEWKTTTTTKIRVSVIIWKGRVKNEIETTQRKSWYVNIMLSQHWSGKKNQKFKVLLANNIVLSYLFDWVDTFMYWLSHFIDRGDHRMNTVP